jgi:hypothetical protein
VLVNFTHTESEAIEGVLVASRPRWLILKDASALKAGQAPVKMPGDVYVDRSTVAYLQVAP